MRREERQISDRKEIDAIIHASRVCRLAMAMDNNPYLVPLSFGYDGEAIYLHTAAAGKKIKFFETNPHVCFEFEQGVQLRAHDRQACKFSFTYESVIGHGLIREIVDARQKKHGLEMIMNHYAQGQWEYNEKAVARTRVWKITVQSLTGKRSPA